MEGLIEGRIVHYVFEETLCFKEPQHRPAIVVNAWGNGENENEEASAANLIVFLDGTNDGPYLTPGSLVAIPYANTMWVTSAVYSKEPKAGTWHWPERA